MQGSEKHFLNTPSTLVVDSLKGLCALNPNVTLDVTHKGMHPFTYVIYLVLHILSVIYQGNPDRSKVALVCGGGSGHEPAHAGYVGALILPMCMYAFYSPNPQPEIGAGMLNGTWLCAITSPLMSSDTSKPPFVGTYLRRPVRLRSAMRLISSIMRRGKPE